MEEMKKRFKMYKSGKNWVVVPLLFFGMISGLQLTEFHASAAESGNSSEITRVYAQQTSHSDPKKNNVIDGNASSQAAVISNTYDDQKVAKAQSTDEKETSSVEEMADATQADSTIERSELADTGDESWSKESHASDSSELSSGMSVQSENKAASAQTKNESSAEKNENKVKQVDFVEQESKKQNQGRNTNILSQHGKVKKNFQKDSSQVKEVYRNGHWFLVDQSGKNLTGFQKVPAGKSNKTVYYNSQGWMLYGQQHIQNYWYHFDGRYGTMSTGLTYLNDEKKTVLYNKKGQMQYGLQSYKGSRYLFNTITGAMVKGQSTYQGKTYYFNNDGRMYTGEKQLNGNWYLFDSETGARATGFQNIADGKNKKTVYYDNQGRMLHGQHQINNAWYHFDGRYGTMSTGLTYLQDQKKTVLYDQNGKMLYGLQDYKGNKYFFQPGYGTMQKGLVNYRGKTYYFNNNGQMYTGEKQLNGNWYLFDNETGERATGFRTIADGKNKKTVYYDNQGRMLHGDHQINNAWYHFDERYGTMSTSLTYLKNSKNTALYNQSGQKQFGLQKFNGNEYFFDLNTGFMQKGFVFDKTGAVLRFFATSDGKLQSSNIKNDAGQSIDVDSKSGVILAKGENQFGKKMYLFSQDGSGRLLIGFQGLKNSRFYYSQSTGSKVFGEKQINGSWYLFDSKTGVMKFGFQTLPKQNKTVYYDHDGKMIHRELNINGHWYYFDDVTGAMVKGFKNIKSQNKTVYYGNNGWMLYGEQMINGSWYHFNWKTGAMTKGFFYLPNNNKTVYYGNSGKMLYGWQIIGNHQYYFHSITGARVSGTVKINNVNYRFNNDGIFQGFTERVLDWFFNSKGKLTYSMYGSRNGSDGTADCSGSMTQALWKAGASKPTASAAQWGGYNTESIHGYLKNNGYRLVAAGTGKYIPQYGDIIIWGKLGASAGAGGHIQIVSTSGGSPKSISTNAYYRDSKGNMAKNKAVQEFDYQTYWQEDDKPYAYVYRPNNLHRG